jgi:hypothetical protein
MTDGLIIYIQHNREKLFSLCIIKIVVLQLSAIYCNFDRILMYGRYIGSKNTLCSLYYYDILDFVGKKSVD